VRSAHAQAAQLDVAVTAVVVDQSGRMIALGRMDRARPITVEIAMNKAYTAASFQQPTKELASVPGRPGSESGGIEQRSHHAGGRRLAIVEGGASWARSPWRAAPTSRTNAAPKSRLPLTCDVTRLEPMATTPGTETPPPPYLGRSVRIVGSVANVDANQTPHPKNSRGELGKALFNWYRNTISRDPLNRVSAPNHFADQRNFLSSW